jgi:hypothetical protein
MSFTSNFETISVEFDFRFEGFVDTNVEKMRAVERVRTRLGTMA